MEDTDAFQKSIPAAPTAIPLSEALYESPEDNTPPVTSSDAMLIGLLPGEGVGPELVDIAKELLEVLGQQWNLNFEFRTGGRIGVEAEAGNFPCSTTPISTAAA